MKMEQNIVNIPIEDIIPNRFQPRLSFEENGLKELSDSIKHHGIIQPLVLRRLGDKYEIIAGERRYKAATIAGLQSVPAIISNIDDNQSAEVALVENIQRKNLTAIEEAKSYRNLLDRGYLTQEQLAEKMGVSQSSIANKLRLLNLHESIQDALLSEKISERHARSLLAIPVDEQPKWLRKIIEQRMTVRQLDMEIKKYKEDNQIVENTTPPQTNIDNLIANSKDISEISNMDVEYSSSQNKENSEEISQSPDEKSNKVPNKFFNFLEDEETNLENKQPIISIPKNNIQPIVDEIDELDNQPLKNNEIVENTFSLNQTNSIEPSNNSIELKPTTREDTNILDPVSLIDKLDPDYEEKQEEASGLDLKTSINMVREKINQMKNLGFNIDIEEIDLPEAYHINLQIKK